MHSKFKLKIKHRSGTEIEWSSSGSLQKINANRKRIELRKGKTKTKLIFHRSKMWSMVITSSNHLHHLGHRLSSRAAEPSLEKVNLWDLETTHSRAISIFCEHSSEVFKWEACKVKRRRNCPLMHRRARLVVEDGHRSSTVGLFYN